MRSVDCRVLSLPLPSVCPLCFLMGIRPSLRLVITSSARFSEVRIIESRIDTGSSYLVGPRDTEGGYDRTWTTQRRRSYTDPCTLLSGTLLSLSLSFSLSLSISLPLSPSLSLCYNSHVILLGSVSLLEHPRFPRISHTGYMCCHFLVISCHRLWQGTEGSFT